MSSCVPQRFLANNRNLLRAAVLTPSSVEPVSDSVIEIPTGRIGTAQVELAGSYTGDEEALYEIEVLDDTVSTKVVSAPVATGAGSGTLSNISASTVAAQDIIVQLQDAGIPELRAGIDFEGERIVSRVDGDAGNGIYIEIDQSSLVFTEQPFSLLADLPAGSGGPTSGLKGAAYDYDTKVLGSDQIIPASAHRISFGDDTGHIHLQYKQYTDGEWLYHFVPAIDRDIPKGARINFVTGGRTVTIADGNSVPLSPPETYVDVETVYDLFNAIKTTSILCDIDGVVAFDRSPTGQAAKELLARTDAHVEPSTGSGSAAATGFTDAFANSNAATELITATCFAVTSKDHPLARLGSERWKLVGSVSGDLGTIVTAVPFVDPDDKFGLTIPKRLPDNFGGQKGRFSVQAIEYVPRDPGVDPYDVAALCPVGLKLGPEAVDQVITLTYTKRPSGDCACKAMPIPNVSGPCLGLTEPGDENTVGYQSDTVTRLKALYAWKAETVSALADIGESVEALLIAGDTTGLASLNTIVRNFEQTLAQIDELAAGTPRTDGGAAWDAAFVALQADITALIGDQEGEYTIEVMENLDEGQPVQLVRDGDLIRAWVFKASTAQIDIGWAVTDLTAGASGGLARVKGLVTGRTALTPGTRYYVDLTNPGAWTVTPQTGVPSGVAMDATTIDVESNATSLEPGPLPEDLYISKLEYVLISAGLSPLGKADDSTLVSGDGCWRDYGDDFYWVPVGSEGAYAPIFNNKKAWGCRLAEDGKTYFSTHEWGLQINVKCPENLLVGDRIILQIGGAGWGATYQVGDTLTLPIIAEQPLQLAGGQDGNEILIWYVTGSVAGALPNFTYDPNAPVAYSAGGLTFTYTPGGIPNEHGDRFTFSIEGGHYRWRKNGGAWMGFSPPDDIIVGPDTFDSGLSIEFIPGNAPSFVAGDTFQFRALQPWAVSNLLTPNRERWQWTGAAPDLVADLGSALDVSMVAVARHTLPVGATLLLEGGVAPGVYLWSETLTYNADTIVKEFATQSARYLRLTLGSATGGGIGWFPVFASGLATTLSAAVQLRRSYKVEASGGGLDQGGKFLARTISGDVRWSTAALLDDDVDGLAALLDWIKENDDEPFCIVPNITIPAEAYMVHCAVDDVDFEELSDYNADVAVRERRYNITMPLSGVWK